MARVSEPVFTVSLEKGLADRQRMPIDQVISVLTEVRHMLTETGHAIQRERGVESPSSLDFGLEIIASGNGDAFHKGSLKAQIAITNNVEIGIAAAQRVIATIIDLGARKPVTRALVPSEAASTARIINRLDRIAYIHERSKADARFNVNIPKAYKADSQKAKTTAVFGGVAIKRLVAMREPVFTEEGVTLYGKLTELKDKTKIDATGGAFWGELKRDNGEKWRVQFAGEYESKAIPLFRQQVRIFGSAHYFQARTPKLVACDVQPDEDRDYLKSFDELVGINRSHYGTSLEALLASRYGED